MARLDMTLRTVYDVISTLPRYNITELEAPKYTNPVNSDSLPRIGLAVESMKYHMTDEGWQIFAGLYHNGYHLAGFGIDGINSTNVMDIVSRFPKCISTIVVQDKREWDTGIKDFREPRAKFDGINLLGQRSDIFKVTILKDAQQRPLYHMESASEMGCHAWIVYYHPKIVKHLAPYVREKHLIRVYHTIDKDIVPDVNDSNSRSKGTLLSGAIGRVYPMRMRIRDAYLKRQLKSSGVDYLRHPGYHRNGCNTPEYLKLLSTYKVAICTSSIYGYSLRKIIEATACGCIVITDLPTDEVLPEIDTNLVRVSSDVSVKELGEIIKYLYDTYSIEEQRELAESCKQYYDYRVAGMRLANEIESLRIRYNSI
jgi:hypothetical protein